MKWHVFGLGGLFRVIADSEEEAKKKAHRLGCPNFSWACLAEESCFKDKEGVQYS